jgi:glyoxylase-like metal-dependent hydrolase (beta-lactamase superfamily II)
MRVSCVSTGAVRPKRAARGVERYLGGGWADHVLPVKLFAIEHPRGVCLFDTGQTARAARPGHFPAWHPFFRLSRFELEEQDEVGPGLRRAGIDPEDVRWIVLSHLHTDHVGGLPTLPRSEVVVTRSEWQRASGWRGRLRGYLPQHWPAALAPRLVDLDGPPVGPFASSLDLLGDGSLVLVPTPGHTPGHASLLVWGDRESYFLAGDLVERAADLPAARPDIAAFAAEHRLVVLTTHDPEATRGA